MALEELAVDRDEDASLGLLVINTEEAAAVNVSLAEAAVDLVTERLDTKIDLVVDKDNTRVDSDKEDNEVKVIIVHHTT